MALQKDSPNMDVPVMLTRDQVRLMRGMVETTRIGMELLPCFADLKAELDRAEAQATFQRANNRVPLITWE